MASVVVLPKMSRDRVISITTLNESNMFADTNGKGTNRTANILHPTGTSGEIYNISCFTRATLFYLILLVGHSRHKLRCFASPKCIVLAHLAFFTWKKKH